MKLAILGSGMIVADFLSMVKALPEIKLQAIFGTMRSQAKMVAWQTTYQIKHVYTDITACLADPAVDTVYVALPNFLHFKFAKLALQAGKNVICEKPFTLKLAQLQELKQLAAQQQLILVEAITNQYLANYAQIKAELPSLGELKVLECNYSQYSSRYDAFKNGDILPAFDPRKGGGALMDLNIYNIHFVVGLLGQPTQVHYYANIEHNIDTSGILVLEYPQTKVVCIGAKDTTATIRSTIEGTDGAIIVNGPTNEVATFSLERRNAPTQTINQNDHSHRMYAEFKAFAQMIATHDLAAAQQRLSHSLTVMAVVEQAAADAGLQLG